MLLGNKQLLSVFFIVLILMAVFFTMGYVLGRDSASRGTYSKAPATKPTAPQSQPVGFPDTSQAAAPAPALPQAEGEVRTVTQRQPQLPTAEPGRPSPPPASRGMATPAAGQVFLQATAGKRPDAELLASVLRKKGFPVVLAPGPTDDVFRVLVGPFEDDEAQRKSRTDLEAAGFKPFTRRY